MKRTTFTILSLLLAGVATQAYASEHENPTPPQDGPHHEKMAGHMFKETDKNDDGFISKEEWIAKGDKMFAEIDTNKDGKLAHDEMKAHHEKKREEWKERREERKEHMEERKDKLKEKLEKLEKKADPATPAEKH